MVNGISKYCYPLRYSLSANMFQGSQHSCSLISPKDLTNPYNYENLVGLTSPLHCSWLLHVLSAMILLDHHDKAS